MKDVKRVLYNVSKCTLKTPPLKVGFLLSLLQHSENILHIFHQAYR